VLTTCQPSTVWCSRERLPAAAAQPAKVRQSCSASDLFIIYYGYHVFSPLIVAYDVYFQSVCKKEGLSLPIELAERIAVQSNGNLRRAILFLESCKVQQYVYLDFTTAV
jgi:hypothetical protein